MSRRPWTDAETQALREHFAQRNPTTQISLAIDRSARQISSKAFSLGLCRGTRAHPATQRAGKAVLALAARPQGVGLPEVSGHSLGAVQHAAAGLMRHGNVFKAKLSHKEVRYFLTAELARAFEALHARPAGGRGPGPGMVSIRRGAPWPADTPAHYPTDKNGRPLYKLTIAPAPPERLYRTNTHSST